MRSLFILTQRLISPLMTNCPNHVMIQVMIIITIQVIMHPLTMETAMGIAWVHTTHIFMVLVDSLVSHRITHPMQDMDHGAKPKTHEDTIAYWRPFLEMV